MIKEKVLEVISFFKEGVIWITPILTDVLKTFFNKIIWGIGLLLSWIFLLTGGEDKVIVCLLVLMVIDYLTGVLKAAHNKEINSQKGFKGFIKKIIILCIIVVAYRLDIAFDMLEFKYNCRFITICFYIANEGISILENAINVGVPVPNKLKEIFEQCKNKEIKKN